MQSISANTWYHIAGTFDGSKLSIYINGSLDSSLNFVGTIGTPASYNLAIGGLGYSPANYNINGKIDEVRIYSEALVAGEIQKHYAEGSEDHKLTINRE